jgi:MFS family permease
MMTSAAPAVTESRTSVGKRNWKTVILASLGGSLEMYDFIIYGVFAAEISRQFFPGADPLVSLIGAFGVFAVGYASRPLGGIVLSSLGDRYGRRVVLLVSVFAMSVSTIAVGLTPGYATIGIAAPVLLIIFRFSQGFFLAGELPCAITYVVEEVPTRGGFVTGIVIFCAISGILVATLASLGIHSVLSPAAVDAYGWRIAFGFGGFIGIASYWVRTSLEESQEFQKMRSRVSKRPFRQLITSHPIQIAVAVGVASIVNGSNSLLFVVLPSYFARVLHYSADSLSIAQNAGIASMAVSLFLFAWLSDSVPSRLIHRVGVGLILLGSFPLYEALIAHNVSLLTAFVLLGVVGGFVNGTFGFLLADLFPTQIRFSGVALSLNLATALFTGMTPLIVTQLLRMTGSLTAPAMYAVAVAFIALVAGMFVKRYSGNVSRASVTQ